MHIRVEPLFVQYQAQSQAISWDELSFVLQGRRFFIAGPLLQVLEYEKPCVLLFDELDKVGAAFEAMLLELLSVWQLSIPKLGTVRAISIPFVVLTLQRRAEVGDPLRRRSFYMRIEHPTPEWEAKSFNCALPRPASNFIGEDHQSKRAV